MLKPKLEILPEAQRALWPMLHETPREFVLYGGTAIALRYGHRQSVDFDFFTTASIDLKPMALGLQYITRHPHSMQIRSNNQLDILLAVGGGEVQVTFLTNKAVIPGAVDWPEIVEGPNIKIASPLDLLGCKILALHQRTEPRDFIDLAELIKNTIDLQKGFEAAVALTRLTPQGANHLRLDRLKEDLASKTIKNILSDRLDAVALIREAASKVNVAKAMKTTMRARPCNYELPE